MAQSKEQKPEEWPFIFLKNPYFKVDHVNQPHRVIVLKFTSKHTDVLAVRECIQQLIEILLWDNPRMSNPNGVVDDPVIVKVIFSGGAFTLDDIHLAFAKKCVECEAALKAGETNPSCKKCSNMKAIDTNRGSGLQIWIDEGDTVHLHWKGREYLVEQFDYLCDPDRKPVVPELAHIASFPLSETYHWLEQLYSPRADIHLKESELKHIAGLDRGKMYSLRLTNLKWSGSIDYMFFYAFQRRRKGQRGVARVDYVPPRRRTNHLTVSDVLDPCTNNLSWDRLCQALVLKYCDGQLPPTMLAQVWEILADHEHPAAFDTSVATSTFTNYSRELLDELKSYLSLQYDKGILPSAMSDMLKEYLPLPSEQQIVLHIQQQVQRPEDIELGILEHVGRVVDYSDLATPPNPPAFDSEPASDLGSDSDSPTLSEHSPPSPGTGTAKKRKTREGDAENNIDPLSITFSGTATRSVKRRKTSYGYTVTHTTSDNHALHGSRDGKSHYPHSGSSSKLGH